MGREEEGDIEPDLCERERGREGGREGGRRERKGGRENKCVLVVLIYKETTKNHTCNYATD